MSTTHELAFMVDPALWVQRVLGAYPGVTLSEARERREAARKLLAHGRDPSFERRLEKIARAAGGNTFQEVCEEFLAKQRREGRAEKTLSKNRWLLEPAYVAFGDRPVGEVTAPELLHALRKFEQRGRYESARRLRSVAGMVFRYAIATGRATRDRPARRPDHPEGQPPRRHYRPHRACHSV